MKDELLKYFGAVGEINNAVTRASNLNEAISEAIKIIVAKFPTDYCIVWLRKKREYQNLL